MAKIIAVFFITTLLGACNHVGRKLPMSVVHVADPATAKQLIGGFYKIEGKSWRWTAREFVVALLPPPGSEERGAKLSLQFFLPDEQIAAIGPMTLKAEIDDFSMSPETFTKGGEHFYIREIPARVLKSNIAPVVFSFDRAKPPSGGDGRELGAVVSMISLTQK